MGTLHYFLLTVGIWLSPPLGGLLGYLLSREYPGRGLAALVGLIAGAACSAACWRLVAQTPQMTALL